MPGFKHGKTYGPNTKKYRLVCEWCGCGFPSSRPETNCCSNAHKLRYYRWQKKYLEMFGTRRNHGPRGDIDVQFYFATIPG